MKFSIVTPVYNMQRFIDATIESVISQEGDFEIEYLIMDGGSTDNTLSIVKNYSDLLESGKRRIACRSVTLSYASEKDAGMYDAINKGFARASGDIYAWINADDLYEPGAFQKVVAVFERKPHIEWLKGIGSTIDEKGHRIASGKCFFYRQDWLVQGIYGLQSYFVDQASVFWRKELWEKVGSIPKRYKLAGDYWLWIAFAAHAPLWSVNTAVSQFRKRAGQLSRNSKAYRGEQRVIQAPLSRDTSFIRIFFSLWSRTYPRLHNLFRKLYPLLFRDQELFYIRLDESGALIEQKTATFALE
jgi:glycosyltransferase involved in cell wall biosynthesis